MMWITLSISKMFVVSRKNLYSDRVYVSHQNLATAVNFRLILDTVAPLMRGLRMVWIISSYYNNDKRMMGLMDRIVWELCERVTCVIDVRMLFR